MACTFCVLCYLFCIYCKKKRQSRKYMEEIMAIFTNQAQITYNGRTILSNIAQGEIIDPVTITKTALGETYRSGDTKAYIVTLSNTSSTTLSNITVNDTLGSYTVDTQTFYPLTYIGPILLFVNGEPSGSITPVQSAPTLTLFSVRSLMRNLSSIRRPTTHTIWSSESNTY